MGLVQDSERIFDETLRWYCHQNTVELKGCAAMKTRTWLIVAVFILLTGGFQTSAFAMSRMGGARGFGGGFHAFHGAGFHRSIMVGPAFGLGWGWGWGYPWYWEPYWGYSWPYAVEGQPVDYGRVEFKVKPDSTKVYVDQKFIGAVRDLDHHRAYMPEGNHDIKLVAAGGKTIERSVYVAAGQTIKIEEKF